VTLNMINWKLIRFIIVLSLGFIVAVTDGFIRNNWSTLTSLVIGLGVIYLCVITSKKESANPVQVNK
jgi:hypothetical protein